MPGPIRCWQPLRARVARETKEAAHYQTSDWRARRQRIMLRDAFRCRDCGIVVAGKNCHVDHVIPLEEGGTDEDGNLVVRCARCHGRKTIGEQRRRGLLRRR